STGMPPHLALGTNKVISTFGTLSASITFIRKGWFKPRFWWSATLGTFVGALSGTVLIYLVQAELLKKLLPLAIMLAAVYLIWPRRGAANVPSLPTSVRIGSRPQWLAGIGIGFYDGFIGPGTGAFWMAVALKAFRQDLVSAAGTARFMNFISNVTAMLTFMALGSVYYPMGLLMGGLLMVGAFIGAHSAIRYGSPFIRPVFISVVLSMAGWLLIKHWSSG
ncbi:MAG: TSUP family transporter, partial [Candidatus Competibacteraceae bacterium]|nr:TSUP family transporter [Candidatus Competibacteraceae bacterium]